MSIPGSQKDLQETPPHHEQKKLIELLESLHRISKIGTYYPAGHSVLKQAAAQFHENIFSVANTNSSVNIELKGEAIFVESYEILAPTIAVVEFRKLLLDLGIGALEIDRTILLRELMQLFKSLLLWRSQLQGIKHFTPADIANLPSSVRIRQKEFLVDENAILLDDDDEDAEHGLNTVFHVLAEKGLERYQIEQCKEFLNSLAEKFSSKPLNVKGLPNVTWSDVRKLLVRVVCNAYNLSDELDPVFAHNDLNALSSIFQGLERETKVKENRETINLLVSVFSGSSFGKKQREGGADKLKGIWHADDIPVLTVEQLQAFVTDNLVDRNTLEKINQIDRREELGILLQLLRFKQESSVVEKIRQNLRGILTISLSTREIEILIRGVMHLATSKDRTRFYNTIHFLTIDLRSAKSFSSLQFLVTVCRKISSAGKALIWPILVNELLASGWTVDQSAFVELMAIAAKLPSREMKNKLPELEKMDCFQQTMIAADIFDSTVKRIFPLFSFLLVTSMKKQIGARILSSLIAYPPDWLIEAVAPLLQLADPQHIKFLQIYLALAQQKNFPVSLRVAAGTLVVRHLPEISEQQRSEAWVEKTIQATPEMQVEETQQLLERIIEEKRMVVVPKWPNACRRAAAEALKNLSRKPLQ